MNRDAYVPRRPMAQLRRHAAVILVFAVLHNTMWHTQAKGTKSPSLSPTNAPSFSPSASPTISPTFDPTVSPTTSSPTTSPTMSPTMSPSKSPSKTPTAGPSNSPTKAPSESPTLPPSKSPTMPPSLPPTLSPSVSPTKSPTTTEKIDGSGESAKPVTVEYKIAGMPGDLSKMTKDEKDNLKGKIATEAVKAVAGSSAKVELTQDSTTTVTVTFPAGTSYEAAKTAIKDQASTTLTYTVNGEAQTFEVDFADAANTLKGVTPPDDTSSAATVLSTVATVLVATVAALF